MESKQIDIDIHNMSGFETLNLVGCHVQVHLIGKEDVLTGKIFTIDPETRSIVLVDFQEDTQTDILKQYFLIPGGSINKCVSNLPIDGSSLTSKTRKNDRENASGSTGQKIENGECAALNDNISSADCSSAHANINNIPAQSNEEPTQNYVDRQNFYKLFRPVDSDFVSTNKKRNIAEASKIFDAHVAKRRQLILDVLNKNNIKYEERPYQSGAAKPFLNMKNTFTRKQILIGQLRINPPYYESDVVCSQPRVRKNLLNVLKDANVFAAEEHSHMTEEIPTNKAAVEMHIQKALLTT